MSTKKILFGNKIFVLVSGFFVDLNRSRLILLRFKNIFIMLPFKESGYSEAEIAKREDIEDYILSKINT